MEVWFYLTKEPRLRGQHTRREIRKDLYPRSSAARQESFCPLDKDLSWKSAYQTSCTWAVSGFIRRWVCFRRSKEGFSRSFHFRGCTIHLKESSDLAPANSSAGSSSNLLRSRPSRSRKEML